MELTSLLKGDDDQPTFDQAKRSQRWLERETAIQVELGQLQRIGTWNLVEKSKINAIPISNKWVLTQKRGKEGNKAHLEARGFTQRPGRDYDGTSLTDARFRTMSLASHGNEQSSGHML